MFKFAEIAKANPLGLPDFRARKGPSRSYAAASVVERAYSAASAGSESRLATPSLAQHVAFARASACGLRMLMVQLDGTMHSLLDKILHSNRWIHRDLPASQTPILTD